MWVFVLLLIGYSVLCVCMSDCDVFRLCWYACFTEIPIELLVQLLRSESDSEWSGSADEHQYGKMQTKIKVLLMSTNVHGKHHLDLENLAVSIISLTRS